MIMRADREAIHWTPRIMSNSKEKYAFFSPVENIHIYAARYTWKDDKQIQKQVGDDKLIGLPLCSWRFNSVCLQMFIWTRTRLFPIIYIEKIN